MSACRRGGGRGASARRCRFGVGAPAGKTAAAQYVLPVMMSRVRCRVVWLPGLWTRRTLPPMRPLLFLVGGFLVACVAAWASPAVAHEGPRDSASVDPEEWAEDDEDQIEDDAEEQARALEEFRPALSPYGRWVVDGRYGRIWVPHASVVGAGFAPYETGGHWEVTIDGDWLWVSDYPFGWVTFHYGRWAFVAGTGWGWVPGYRYAPAWVTYRVGAGGYVGWAPRPPRRVWRGSAFVVAGFLAPPPFIFCPTRFLFARSFHYHVVRDRARVVALERRSRRYRVRRRSNAGVRVYAPSFRAAAIPREARPERRVSLDSRRRRRVDAYSRATRVRGDSRVIVSDDRSRRRAMRARQEPMRRARRAGARQAQGPQPRADRPRSDRQRPRRVERRDYGAQRRREYGPAERRRRVDRARASKREPRDRSHQSTHRQRSRSRSRSGGVRREGGRSHSTSRSRSDASRSHRGRSDASRSGGARREGGRADRGRSHRASKAEESRHSVEKPREARPAPPRKRERSASRATRRNSARSSRPARRSHRSGRASRPARRSHRSGARQGSRERRHSRRR